MTFWIIWPEAINYCLVVTTFMLGLVPGMALIRREIANPLQILTGCAVTVLVFGGVLGSCFLMMRMIPALGGHAAAFPEILWPWRSILLGTGLTVSYLVVWGLKSRFNFWSLTLGVWLFWWLLATSSAVWLPGVTGILLIPVILMSLFLLFLGTMKAWSRRHSSKRTAVFSLFIALPSTIIPALQLEDVHGYGHLFFVFMLPPVGLFFTAFLPILNQVISLSDQRKYLPLWIAIVAIILGMVSISSN